MNKEEKDTKKIGKLTDDGANVFWYFVVCFHRVTKLFKIYCKE